MGRCCGCLILFSLTGMLMAAQTASSPEEPAVRAVIERYLDAREHRDSKGLAELFTTDADQLVSTGEWRRGREAIVHGTLASSEAAGGHRTITIQTVRLLAPTVALADGPYQIAGVAGGEDRKMWTTFLLRREPGGSWRIAAIRNMRPAAPAFNKGDH